MWQKILKIEVTKSEQFEKKAKYLIDTYKCFTESDKCVPPKWLKKKTVEFKTNTVERKKIGTKELSIEAITRKEFLSLMNKLTLNNKQSILKNVASIIRKDYTSLYIDIIWDLMQRAPEFRTVYYEVFKLLDNTILIDKWLSIWDTYYNNKNWIPCDEILNDNEDYDEFCDFVKWKKRALAAINIWIMLYEKNIIGIHIIELLIKEIVSDCSNQIEHYILNQNINIKKLDVLLEQILILINFTKTDQDDHFIELIKKWIPRADSLKPSTRFKLYDINDTLQGKMKSVYRVRKN